MPNQSNFSTSLAYVEESTPGTTPASPTMILLPTTDPLALQRGRETFNTDQVFSHRAQTALREGRKSIGGNIPIELQYKAFDDMLEALLGGTWPGTAPFDLKLGNNVKTFSIERSYPDINQYTVFTGATPSELSLDVNPDGIVTGSFSYVGMGWNNMGTTQLASSPTDNTNTPFDGLCNMTLSEGGSSLGIGTSLSLSISNGMATTGVIGSCDSSEPAAGDFAVTGTITARLQDSSLVSKFEGNTDTSLEMVFTDPDGNTQTWTLHRLRYTNANPQENDNAVDISMDFTALYDETESTPITISHS